MTETKPDPVLLLLKLIEDLCEAIAQATGLNLFTRLMLIPVRRKLRGMAQAVAEVAADRAARAADAPGPDALASATLAPDSTQDTTQPAAAAPSALPGLADAPRPQTPLVQRWAAAPAAPSEQDAVTDQCPASHDAPAPVIAKAGRGNAPQGHIIPARIPAATASPLVAPAIALLRAAGTAAHGPPPNRSAIFGWGFRTRYLLR